jgi:hypothetical protein
MKADKNVCLTLRVSFDGQDEAMKMRDSGMGDLWEEDE